METIKLLTEQAQAIMSAGGPRTGNEIEIMKIYNQLNGKKAGNAGKRTKKNHNNNW